MTDPFNLKSLYIGDLPDWMDENYVFALLSSSGDIINVKIIRNKLTGVSDGYGFIECNSHDAANRVLELYNGKPIHDTGVVFRMNWAVHGQGKRTSSEDHSLFVGDLAGEVTEGILLEHFKTHYPTATNARVIMDLTTGRSKGYGFVRFSTEQARDHAIHKMHGTVLRSKIIRVSEATNKKFNSQQQQGQGQQSGYPQQHLHHQSSPLSQQYGSDLSNTTLFVGNISPMITEEYLKSTFSHFGEIVYVKIPVGRNCGFVQFTDRHSAERALASMNNQVLGDSTVRVSWGRNSRPNAAAAAAGGGPPSSGAVQMTQIAQHPAPPPYPYSPGYAPGYDPNILAAYGYDPNAYAAYYGAYGYI
eukprot:g8737.t2